MSDKPAARLEGSKVVYRASAVGGCLRGLVASRLGYDPLPPDPGLETIFKEGHRHETLIIEDLEADGIKVDRFDERGDQLAIELPISERVVIEGHLDGITDGGRVLECKALSQTSFEKWQRKGFGEFQTYADQITCYMAATGRSALYAVKNRNTGRVSTQLIDEPPSDIKEIKARVLKAEMYARRGELPPCDRKKGWGCAFRYLHDNGDEGATFDEAIESLARAYREAAVREKEAAGMKAEAKERLMQQLGDTEKAESSSYRVSRYKTTRGRWNEEKMQEELGAEAVERYKLYTTTETLRVTEKKKED